MTPKQAPSGSWYIRKTINGKQHYINFDSKPTKHEIEKRIDEIKAQGDFIAGTFKTCAEEYIASKSNVLSVTTIESYRSILRNLTDAFVALKMALITQVDVQREINTYAKTRSPKSTRNASGFITAVIWFFRPNLQLHTKLPQKENKQTYIPTDEEVKQLMEAIKGDKSEIAILLAICGLRKSEAIAITKDDVDGNILTINKSKVKNEKGEFIIKDTTKNTTSTRQIFIPDYLANLIRKEEVAYKYYPNNILRELHRFQDKLGIPRCKYHALRHYYVSYAHSMGIPDAYIAEAVGHKNTNTTRAIYLHAQQDKKTDMQKRVAQGLFE